MARFYGEMQGNRGAASRMGDAWGGFWGHIRGWNVGAEIRMRAVGDKREHDVCDVYATGGSAGGGSTLLGSLEVAASPDSVVFRPSRELRDAILKAEGRKAVDDRPRSVVIR